MTMPYACTRCMMPTEEAVCPVCGAKTENAQRIRDALPPQTILHGQYLLGAALGGGGFGHDLPRLEAGERRSRCAAKWWR